MDTIVILGAGGRIGDAAARAFVRAGWEVRGVVRDAKRHRLAPGVIPVEADAYDRVSLIGACRGANVVLNALNPLYTEWQSSVLPMARNVLAAVEASGATHMMPGNIYNYGHDLDLDMKEGWIPAASTPKAGIRIEMEGLFERAAAERNVQTIIVRAGDFYGGTGTGSWMDLIILAKLRRDIFTWPGPMDIAHAFAYLPDLGEVFAALAAKRSLLGRFETFHFRGHTMTGVEMKRATEEAIGRKLRLRGVPWPLLRAAGLFMPLMREISIMSYLWRTPHSLDDGKLRNFLGDLPSTPPVEALGQVIAELELDRQVRRAA